MTTYMITLIEHLYGPDEIEKITHTQCVRDYYEAVDVYNQTGSDTQGKLSKAITENKRYSAIVFLVEFYNHKHKGIRSVNYIG